MLTTHEHVFLNDYQKQAVDVLHMIFPQLTTTELSAAVEDSINRRLQNSKIIIDNSYKRQEVQTTLLELVDYIKSRGAIMTNQGVLFSSHTSGVKNPIAKMLDGFLIGRKAMKKRMFQYPKGTSDFAKYNLLQLLLKIDANGYYGCSGQYSAIYYNLYAASSVTMQGRQANATAALFFEQFLANNVPFESIEELMIFIDNVKNEQWVFKDWVIGLRNVSLEECFFKLLYNCGFDWIPSYDEMEIIWHVLAQFNQTMLNRLYYKNNLYEFMENEYPTRLLLNMLSKLDKPFLDPNSPPDCIKDEIEEFNELLRDFVFYRHQICSKIEKMDALIRDVSIIQDTDSAIISFDAFYRWGLQKTYGVPMAIKQTYYNLPEDKIEEISYVSDYDFFNDELIEAKRYVRPVVMIPQDGLRHSIVAIIAHCCGNMLNEYVEQMCTNFNAVRAAGCRLMLKNEFYYSRLLINTLAKKHYAGRLELQEGNEIPYNGSSDVDIKGMEAFVKSTMNPTIQSKLKKILYEDILKPENIDQIAVLKNIAIIEKEIYNSIHSGEKLYYKPAKIKSASSYESPMTIQGVKASVAYNALHEDGTETIDTTQRNSIDIIKVEITRKNIDLIKNDYPQVYEKAIHLMDTVEQFKSGIDSIAIPLNEPVPKWVLPFVRYAEIINDNVAAFPLESIGLYRGNSNNNSTNLISF